MNTIIATLGNGGVTRDIFQAYIAPFLREERMQVRGYVENSSGPFVLLSGGRVEPGADLDDVLRKSAQLAYDVNYGEDKKPIEFQGRRIDAQLGFFLDIPTGSLISEEVVEESPTNYKIYAVGDDLENLFPQIVRSNFGF